MLSYNKKILKIFRILKGDSDENTNFATDRGGGI